MPDPIPVEPIPPAEYLRDELEARGWDYVRLAKELKAPVHYAQLFARGDIRITPGRADLLARAFGSNAQTWLNLQANYDEAVAAQAKRRGGENMPDPDNMTNKELRRENAYLAARVAQLDHQAECHWYDISAGQWALDHCEECRRLDEAVVANDTPTPFPGR
jgi:plasmid maintenance system antidote protein VapI